jgi:hypothetical protein
MEPIEGVIERFDDDGTLFVSTVINGKASGPIIASTRYPGEDWRVGEVVYVDIIGGRTGFTFAHNIRRPVLN